MQLTISQATRELEVAPRSNMRDQSPTCRAGSFEKHMIDSTVIFGVKRLHYLKNLNDQDWRWSVDPRSGKSCSQFEGLFSQMLLVMQPSYEHWIYNLGSIQMGQTMWYHSHVIRWPWGLTRETGEVILNRCTHTGHLTVGLWFWWKWWWWEGRRILYHRWTPGPASRTRWWARRTTWTNCRQVWSSKRLIDWSSIEGHQCIPYLIEWFQAEIAKTLEKISSREK